MTTILPTFTTEAEILAYFNVSNAQVCKAHRIVNMNVLPYRPYYLVESSQDDGTEYTVVFNRSVKHLTCTCKAGQNGIPCWHKRAAQAEAAITRLTRRLIEAREQAEAQAEQDAGIQPLPEDKLDGFKATKHEAQATRRDGLNAYNRPPFSFMR